MYLDWIQEIHSIMIFIQIDIVTVYKVTFGSNKNHSQDYPDIS